jgi:16S rRNA (adenine(1408)-N(1))-methyltransferase
VGALRQVVGRRVTELDQATVDTRFAGYRRATIDVGTGNGRPVLARAAAGPDALAVGLDADAAAMAEASRRAARRPERGGLPNALFIVAGAEALPAGLRGRFDEVTVLFPWGSLLRRIVGGQAEAARSLADLLRPGGQLLTLLSLTEHDAGLGGVPAYLDRASLEPAIAAFASAGLELIECRPAERAEVLDTRSSWAKRIGAGTARRPAWLVRWGRPGTS